MSNFTPLEISIDISNSNSDNIKIDRKELIHYNAYSKVEKAIQEHIDIIRNISMDKIKNFSNLSIFIDGTRGAGKSTFLKNTTNALINTRENYKLEKLIYIDPSKIEIKEHIFLTLIAQLNQKIKKSKNFHHLDEMDNKYELWRKKLKKLAGGLRLLNSEQNPYDLIDDDVFLDWGLDRADDAMQLSSAFFELIQHACEILNCDAFIVLIDDADTHFKKGEQVLEMVRRYLDIPQIIVVMAGDLQLYTDLVRGLYIGNMNENLYKYDQNRNKERANLLDHMEDQYLKKIFPIQHRVSLQPLKQLVKQTNYIVKTSDTHTIELELAIDKLIKFAFHINISSDIKAYREFILQQPLRSVLQLLQSSSEIYTKEITQENLFKITPQLSQSFRDAFLSSLYAAKIEVDKLNNRDENALIESVFDTVIKEGGQDTRCYLRPQAIDENLRNSFVALSSSVADFTQGKASSAINYMLQCSGSVSLFYHIKDELKLYTTNEELQLQLFKSYCGIGQHEDALNWAWHATAVLMSKKSSASIKAGIIKLKTTSNKSDKEANKITAYDFIETDRVGSLSFALGLIEVVGEKKQLYFSIFNILGVVGRLLEIGEQHIGSPIITSELRIKVTNCLRKLEITLGISEPNWSQRSTDLSPELDYKEGESIDQSYMQKWIDSICNWLVGSHEQLKRIQPSSILLGKVWIRLYFSLIGVATSKQDTDDVGKIISLYTHCLLNAFLVEEADHHLQFSEVKRHIPRNNPINFLETVNRKFNNLELGELNSLPLTKIIAYCPLIRGLLPTDIMANMPATNFVSFLPHKINQVIIFNDRKAPLTERGATNNNVKQIQDLERKVKQLQEKYEQSKKILDEKDDSLNQTKQRVEAKNKLVLSQQELIEAINQELEVLKRDRRTLAVELKLPEELKGAKINYPPPLSIISKQEKALRENLEIQELKLKNMQEDLENEKQNLLEVKKSRDIQAQTTGKARSNYKKNKNALDSLIEQFYNGNDISLSKSNL